MAEKNWQACQKRKLCVQWRKSRENVFWRKIKFFIILVFWVKTFRTTGKKVSEGLSKMQTECPGEYFEDKWFLEKYVFDRFRTSGHFFQNLDKNTSVRLTSLLFSCPGEDSEQKHNSWKNYFFILFRIFNEKLGFLAKTFPAGSSYLHSWYPEERTEEKRLFRKISFLNQFRTYFDREILWLHSEKKDSQGCQNYVLRVQGNVLRNITGGKNSKRLLFLFIFVLWPKKLSVFGHEKIGRVA